MELGERYEPHVIKNYGFWALCLSEEQFPYVGRCYAWFMDSGGLNGENLAPWDLPDFMLVEGIRIGRMVRRAHAALGYHTEPYGEEYLLNTCYLSNGAGHNHHLHWHFIPRTKSNITIPEINVVIHDKEWGGNYIRSVDAGEYKIPPQDFEYIRQRMKNALA